MWDKKVIWKYVHGKRKKFSLKKDCSNKALDVYSQEYSSAKLITHIGSCILRSKSRHEKIENPNKQAFDIWKKIRIARFGKKAF